MDCQWFLTLGQWRNLMRENLTTAVEIAGAILITVGVGLALGAAAGCIIGGIFCLGFGWMAGK
jgi:hypothetical protein